MSSKLFNRLRSIQEYPLVLRAELDRLQIYSPDLGVHNLNLPSVQALTKADRAKYYMRLGAEVLKTWKTIEETRERLTRAGQDLPEPSKAHFPTRPQNERALSPVEIAKLKGCHKDTVRRAIDRGELRSFATPGGHRRVLESEATRWLGESSCRKRGQRISPRQQEHGSELIQSSTPD